MVLGQWLENPSDVIFYMWFILLPITTECNFDVSALLFQFYKYVCFLLLKVFEENIEKTITITVTIIPLPPTILPSLPIELYLSQPKFTESFGSKIKIHLKHVFFS